MNVLTYLGLHLAIFTTETHAPATLSRVGQVAGFPCRLQLGSETAQLAAYGTSVSSRHSAHSIRARCAPSREMCTRSREPASREPAADFRRPSGPGGTGRRCREVPGPTPSRRMSCCRRQSTRVSGRCGQRTDAKPPLLLWECN